MSQITPEVFSVIDVPRRTNNHVESHHRQFNIFIGVERSIWRFIGNISYDFYEKSKLHKIELKMNKFFVGYILMCFLLIDVLIIHLIEIIIFRKAH